MNTEQETNIRMEENELNLGDILQTVLANWYWFVLSVVVCAGTAFLYLKWAPKVYTRTASVLIKDDAKGGAMSESAAFEDLGLFGSKRNVDNEVLVFKSRRLMTEVARNLHLDVSYTVKDGLRTVELYTQSPVQLSFPDAEEAQAFSLKARSDIIFQDFDNIHAFCKSIRQLPAIGKTTYDLFLRYRKIGHRFHADKRKTILSRMIIRTFQQSRLWK